GAVAGTGPVDANGAVSNGWTKAIGVVAVAQGDGWRALLESLGVDQVVAGGQTMNPSAAELVAAIEAVQAPDVVVLPNNSNIVFTARQAMELTDRRLPVVPPPPRAPGRAATSARRHGPGPQPAGPTRG